MEKVRLSNFVKSLLVLSMIAPLLTGCWDRLEIEERAIVLGVSIDSVSQENEDDEDEVTHIKDTIPVPEGQMIRVGVQIAIPGKIPLGPGESGGGGKGGGGQTVWVIDVVGHSVDDAFMNLQQQMSSRLFFGHLRVIVVSEDLAARGMENINDYFRRNSEVRRMAWMVVSKGKAKAFMEAAPKLERVPTLYLMTTVEEAIRMGKFPKDFIGIYWSNTSKKGQEGFLPYVELKKEQNVEISGLAFFKGAKMVGVSKPLEIGAFLAIKGINPAGYRAFVKLDGTKETVMIASTHRKSKLDVRFQNGRPHFTIHIALDINLEEKMSDSLNLNDPKIIRRIEQTEAEASNRFGMEFIRKSQEFDSDIFGFGEYVRAKKPGYWNRNVRSAKKWQEIYKDASFEVITQVRVRRVGMKAR
ncbi:Ger(x)C family spore germination protein [Cohnella thailandensis]|uniref:Ger(X)C family spore germination protein n=1 Tax=Cohnella thailandensis TaxID=557557 RepID=A0A841T8H7_9BACL|nr:Ger(x)C family spore germination protein [Cohnella thailandensis]MBB6638360.1 Ger(x)C family spore germination protein [Cohnella thailandensis]MBP1977162.1 spore germination protein KC [Cohnella thailandensis]